MDLNKLTKEELIDFGESEGVSLDISDEKEVLLSKLNEALDNLLSKNAYVSIGDDYRTICALCNKKITSEEPLPDGYEEMYQTMSYDLCDSCFDEYTE